MSHSKNRVGEEQVQGLRASHGPHGREGPMYPEGGMGFVLKKYKEILRERAEGGRGPVPPLRRTREER